MNDRRVLSTPQANTEEAALRLLPSWKRDPTVSDPASVKAELVGGRWAVTAAKTKKEGR